MRCGAPHAAPVRACQQGAHAGREELRQGAVHLGGGVVGTDQLHAAVASKSSFNLSEKMWPSFS